MDSYYWIERFENFYFDRLTESEREEIKAELDSDPELKSQYEDFAATMDALSYEALKTKIASNPEIRKAMARGLSEKSGTGLKRRWVILGIVAILVVALLGWLYQSSELIGPVPDETEQTKPMDEEGDKEYHMSARIALVDKYLEKSQFSETTLRGIDFHEDVTRKSLDHEISACRELISIGDFSAAVSCLEELNAETAETTWLYALALLGKGSVDKANQQLHEISSSRINIYFSLAEELLDEASQL